MQVKVMPGDSCSCAIAGFDESERDVLAKSVATGGWLPRIVPAEFDLQQPVRALIWKEPDGAEERSVLGRVRLWATLGVQVLCLVRSTPVELVLRHGAFDGASGQMGPELIERVRLMLQRLRGKPGMVSSPVLELGDVRVCLLSGNVSEGGKHRTRMTRTQLELFRYMVSRPGEFATTSDFQRDVLRSHGDGGAVRYHICMLRQALGEAAWVVQERRKFGYRFSSGLGSNSCRAASCAADHAAGKATLTVS